MRFITLQNGFWRAFDWMVSERGIDQDHLIAYLWDTVSKEENAAYQFAAGLEHFIHTYVQGFIKEEDGLANDDYSDPDWLLTLQDG